LGRPRKICSDRLDVQHTVPLTVSIEFVGFVGLIGLIGFVEFIGFLTL
jgi:hypothetical protein